jgi:YggT family protein
MDAATTINAAARYTVAAVFFISLLVAVLYWTARREKINAFGWLARTTRRLLDPIMVPLERRVIRFGGSPRDAPIWLVGFVVVLGLLLLAFVDWLIGAGYYAQALAHGGFREWARFAVDVAYFVLSAAIIVRVVGTWLGMGRYNRWSRPAYWLTDWLVEPIRRRLPPFGFIDLSPVAAYVVLWMVHRLLVAILQAARNSPM